MKNIILYLQSIDIHTFYIWFTQRDRLRSKPSRHMNWLGQLRVLEYKILFINDDGGVWYAQYYAIDFKIGIDSEQ